MKHNDFTVKVTLWGIPIGSLVWDSERMCSVFTFSEEYLNSKFDISPTFDLGVAAKLRLFRAGAVILVVITFFVLKSNQI